MEYSLINADQNKMVVCKSSSRVAVDIDSSQPSVINNLSLEERHELVRQYGYQSSSYFSLQQGVDHIGIAGFGFVAFYPQRILGTTFNIAFTNPVCAPENIPRLVELLECITGNKTIFMAVDKQCTEQLISMNYSCNDMGLEYHLPIADYQIKGKQMKYLRWAANLGKRGFVVKEQKWNEVDAEQVKHISTLWRHTKAVKDKELRLITRPPEFRDAWEVRKFFCYYEGEMVGFVFFDPFFKNGKLMGYTANILRGIKDIHPNGFLDFTLLEAMQVFKEEGVPVLSLGISPLHEIAHHPKEIKWVRMLQKLMYRYGSSFYAFQQLAYHKTRYRAESTMWFQCVPPNSSAIKAAAAVLLAINVF
ncbi:MAG: lysylphosphatidylglycerol synthetase-like protein (DUF2156 family) [Oleiphilaceae bacterium]|jgi:lysylphosphatidylglycerol synthetase-like protein (DUF2156 family)